MAIKIQKIKGKRVRAKHEYRLRLDFMIGDADHYYETELTFDPDSKEESYIFEKLTRVFKRAAGDWTNGIYSKIEVITQQIKDSLVNDEKFCTWLSKKWDMPHGVDEHVLDDFLTQYLEWGSCEYSGRHHTITSIDYWYIDSEGDKCKVSFTGSMKL